MYTFLTDLKLKDLPLYIGMEIEMTRDLPTLEKRFSWSLPVAALGVLQHINRKFATQ